MVDAAGAGDRRPGTTVRRPMVDWLFTLIESGEALVEAAGERVAIPAGGTFVIPPGLAWSVRFASPVRLHWVHAALIHDPAWRAFPHRNDFQCDEHRRHLVQPGAEAVYGCRLPLAVPTRLRPLFRRELPALVERWRSGGVVDTLAANAALARLMLALVGHVRAADAAPGGLGPAARLVLAMTVARRCSGIGLGVADLARVCGWSRAHFTARFAAQAGEGPGAFLRRLRLEEARSRLATQDWPIAELAGQCGYPDAASFARAFRRAFGVTPTRWRRSRDHAGA